MCGLFPWTVVETEETLRLARLSFTLCHVVMREEVGAHKSCRFRSWLLATA